MGPDLSGEGDREGSIPRIFAERLSGACSRHRGAGGRGGPRQKPLPGGEAEKADGKQLNQTRVILTVPPIKFRGLREGRIREY